MQSGVPLEKSSSHPLRYIILNADSELSELAKLLRSLDGETRVVVEATGNYHTLMVWLLNDAGPYVSVVHAKLVHGYGDDDLRRVKADRIFTVLRDTLS